MGAPGGIALSYDPLGRLFQIAGAPWGTRRFLYDGDALVAVYNGGSGLEQSYVHGPGADVPLVWYEGGARRYLHADHQGSIVQVTWNSGDPYGTNAYDEYGVPGSANVGRFQYTGQVWLSEIGMYHYKARIYSPTLGRFLQTDPIGYEDQINLYAYVGNDPVNGTDPTGECQEIVGPDGNTQKVGICAREQIGYDTQPRIDEQIGDRDSSLGALEKNLVARGEIAEVVISETSSRGIPINNPDRVDRTNNGFLITIDPNEYEGPATGANGEAVTHSFSFPEVIEHAGGHVQGLIDGDGNNFTLNEQNALNAENAYRKSKGSGVTRTMEDRRGPIRRTGRSILPEPRFFGRR